MSQNVLPAVLITGSSRGIGLSAAIQLAKSGFAVALNGPTDDVELQDAATTVAKYGTAVETVVGDVIDLSLHKGLLDRAEAASGLYLH